MGERVSPRESRLLPAAMLLLESFLAGIYRKLSSRCSSWVQGSAIFGALMRVRSVMLELLSGSLIWPRISALLRSFLVPPGENWGLDTLFGAALALAVLHSSELAVMTLALVLILKLYRRISGRGVWRGVYGVPAMTSRGSIGQAGEDGLPIPAGLFLPLFALILFAAGAAFASVTPAYSARNLVMWLFYAFSFVLGLDVARRGKALAAALPVLFATTVAGAYGIYQHLTGFQSYEGWLDPEFADVSRITGTFSNPSFFSQTLALTLPVAVALVLSGGGFRYKVILLGSILIQGVALALTLGRAAWIGCMLSLAVVAVLYDKRLIVVGFVVVLIASSFAPEFLVKRFLSAFSMEDSSNNYRVSVWRGSLALARAYFLTGTGLGAESFVYTYPEYMIIGSPAWHSHCVYLEILIEMGILGLIAFLWMLVAWAVYTWRGLVSAGLLNSGSGSGPVRNRSGSILRLGGLRGAKWARAAVAVGAASAVLGSLAQGLVEHTLYSPRVALLFWAWAGLSAGLSLYATDEGALPRTQLQVSVEKGAVA
ncbi:MAG: O-antigen ligase family protein [Firmicutes bacterium]|nr:O-antigen ligase family protein [Candidatus Fermentithermobacillaceae bacterium]